MTGFTTLTFTVTTSSPIQLAELRKALEEESLSPYDQRVEQIVESPYFLQCEVLSEMLSLLKKAEGEKLGRTVGNLKLILPKLWPKLRVAEKGQIGQTYEDIYVAGKHFAALGLKNVLLLAQGFDFVPQTLRSDTFARAAKRLIEAHFSMNNYYKETVPAFELASLGSEIPKSVFPICMTAILCARLGNAHGFSWSAQASVNKILIALRNEQWEHYLNECLSTDKTILDKLEDDSPASRWHELCLELKLPNMRIDDPIIRELVESTSESEIRGLLPKIRSFIRG